MTEKIKIENYILGKTLGVGNFGKVRGETLLIDLKEAGVFIHTLKDFMTGGVMV
jgi:hypothetical protein